MSAHRLRTSTGLPSGQIIYADTSRWLPSERPLFSAEHQLSGRPDYLIQNRRDLIPIEVKSSSAPASGPYHAHLMQLATYCLLVEENHGRRPPFGIIHYTDHTLQIEYTKALEYALLDTLDAMRQALEEQDAPRNHKQAGRCAHCGYRYTCDDALV